MWNLPRPGVKPVSPALAGWFLTTGPPGRACLPSSSFKWGHQSYANQNSDYVRGEPEPLNTGLGAHSQSRHSLPLNLARPRMWAQPLPSWASSVISYCGPARVWALVPNTGAVRRWAVQDCLQSQSLALPCPHLLAPSFRTSSLALRCLFFYSRTFALSLPLPCSLLGYQCSAHSICFSCITQDLVGLCGTWRLCFPILESLTLCSPLFPSFVNQQCSSMVTRNSLKPFLAASLGENCPEPRECGLTFKKSQRLRG